ncbi:MAG: hypothetical protein ACOH1T_07950 [Microbacteriaceae bacterium]
MRILAAALVLSSALLVSGCALQAHDDGFVSEPALLESTVPSDSMPGFLDESQAEEDKVQNDFLDSINIDPASIRLQGQVKEERIYLAVTKGSNSVQIIHGTPGTDSWAAGGSYGNGVLGSSLSIEGDGFMQYLPQGTSDIPEGWTSFSDWIVVQL